MHHGHFQNINNSLIWNSSIVLPPITVRIKTICILTLYFYDGRLTFFRIAVVAYICGNFSTNLSCTFFQGSLNCWRLMSSQRSCHLPLLPFPLLPPDQSLFVRRPIPPRNRFAPEWDWSFPSPSPPSFSHFLWLKIEKYK